jgi:dTDP-4-dehydrorhamnose 3,5-epimerase-like enzyme
MYKINKDLKETKLINTLVLNDQRGFLSPLTDDIDPDLINRACFVGDYGRGVIRGVHYHKKEWKIYTVLTGAAKFLSVDIPEDLVDNNDELAIKEFLKANPSYISSYVLSYRSPKVLVIPPYRANGWMSLEENTNIIFLSNLTYKEALADDYRYHHSIVSQKYWEVN